MARSMNGCLAHLHKAKNHNLLGLIFIVMFDIIGAVFLLPGHAAPPSCTTTLNVGANVGSALQSAASGSVVCLNSGTWAAQTLSGMTPSSMVTLQPAPGQSVTMGGFTTTGQVNNLTVQGITFTNTFFMRAGISNLILQYNTFENFSAYAVHGNPQSINVGPTINGVQVLHNQMDFVSDCVRGDGDENNWTISNNVCGPGIGQGGNVDDH